MRNIRIAVLAVSAATGAVTVAAALFPRVIPAFRAPPVQAAAAMVPPLLALLAGLPVLGRLRRIARLNDLILACCLGVLALSGLAFVAVPLFLHRFWPDLSVWAALAGSAVGAALFALAAFAPRRRLRRPGPALTGSGAAVMTTLVMIAVLAAAFATRLPTVPSAMTAHSLPAASGPHTQAILRTAQFIAATSYGLAAAGFLRRSGQCHDELSGWLAISAVLAAAAHLNYFLHPALYLYFVSVGDVFLVCFYAVLLGGSAQETWSYWRSVPEAAALAERRRIARDLHDGPAQELAYLLRNIDSLDGAVDKQTKAYMRRAAERAELDIRLAIDAISTSRSKSVNAAIAQAVGEVAARDHIKLELDFVPGIRLSPARADALARIACEAVSNAARHGGAARVSLSLQRQGGHVRLRVRDDGAGFDTAAQADGFGLGSMRDRATSAGGDLRISSAPGRGTEVEVRL